VHSRAELLEEGVAVEGLEELVRGLGAGGGALGAADSFDRAREVEDLAAEGVGWLTPDRSREQEEGQERWREVAEVRHQGRA